MTVLHAWCNYQCLIAIKSRQHQINAKCSLSNRNLHVRYQIIFFTLIHLVRRNFNVHIQITSGTTTRTYTAATTYPHRLTSRNTGRNINLVSLIFGHSPFTATFIAR